MGNKTTETSCLNIAIEKCLKQKGLSKKIGRLLSGNDINRENDEAPDFLRYCPPTDKEEGIVIGIEHFRVDHYAEELKNKKVSSLGCQFERRINDTVQTWKPQPSLTNLNLLFTVGGLVRLFLFILEMIPDFCLSSVSSVA